MGMQYQSGEAIASDLKMKVSDWRIFESGKVIPPKEFWIKLASLARKYSYHSAELQELLERAGVHLHKS